MPFTPAVVGNNVLFRPGTNSAVAGGYPWCAAQVIGTDATGMIASLHVIPPSGTVASIPSVRHASVAAVGEQCWTYPTAAAAGLLTPVSSTLTVSDSVPATMPLPCLAGTGMVTPSGSTPSTFAGFSFWRGFLVATFSFSNGLTPSISGSSPPYTLTITSIGISSPAPCIVAIWPAGQ
jgi:hypothetical protein